MREFPFESKSSPGTMYTARITDDDLLECNCRGYFMKKEGKPYECTHTKKVAADLKLTLEERDGHLFVTQAGTFTFVPGGGAATAPAVVAAEPIVDGFIQPMLASKMPDNLTMNSYSAESYVMEEKFDGHRIIMAKKGETVQARSKLDNVRTLPKHIAALARSLPDGIYDGELTVPGGHSYDVTAGMNSGREVMVLFDLLHLYGESIMSRPFHERRGLLALAHAHVGPGPILLSEQYPPSEEKVAEIWARGGEGAIIKKLSATYRPGYRTGEWVKVKKVGAATVTIIAYKAGESGPHSSVNVRDDDGIETTVKTLNNATLREMAACPQCFIGKRLVISFQERVLKSRKYRHPMWDHMAGDAE